MFKRDYAGSILVNGISRKIDVSGNAMNRTTIRLDGVTVYDKTSLWGNRPIQFVAIPGRRAVLRWQPDVGRLECEVTVDGKTSRVPRTGNVEPMSLENQSRVAGAGALCFGILSLLLNYYDLKKGQYWTSLGTEPFFILAGLSGVLFPRTLLNWKHKMPTVPKAVTVIGFVLFFAAALFMKTWLMTWMIEH